MDRPPCDCRNHRVRLVAAKHLEGAYDERLEQHECLSAVCVGCTKRGELTIQFRPKMLPQQDAQIFVPPDTVATLTSVIPDVDVFLAFALEELAEVLKRLADKRQQNRHIRP